MQKIEKLFFISPAVRSFIEVALLALVTPSGGGRPSVFGLC